MLLDKNPLVSESLFDVSETDSNGLEVYSLHCCNVEICESYLTPSYCCFAGAYENKRCSYAEKMNIRILNDMNINALHKPEKPKEFNL